MSHLYSNLVDYCKQLTLVKISSLSKRRVDTLFPSVMYEMVQETNKDEQTIF